MEKKRFYLLGYIFLTILIINFFNCDPWYLITTIMQIITKCIQCNRLKNIAMTVSVRHIRKSPILLNEEKDNFGKKKILEQIKEHKEKSSSSKDGLTKSYIMDVLLNPRSEPVPVDFKLVYKFSLVRYFALVNRLKLYHTISSAVASTAVSGLYLSGIVPETVLNTTVLSSLTGCLLLYSLGFAATRFVGFVYVNEKTDMVRIAYVDFWGRRRDIEVHISDIVPRSESPVNFLSKLYFTVRRYSTEETLKLVLEPINIVDLKKFNTIL